jgi:hypothetical protein
MSCSPSSARSESRSSRAKPIRSVGGQATYLTEDWERLPPYTSVIKPTSGRYAGETDLSTGHGLYFHHPGVAVVTWDPSSRTVRLEAQGRANSTEFAAAFDAVLAALTENRGTLWLVDCRQMRAVKQSDHDWIDASWFPRALPAGLMHIAVVVPKRGLAMMNIDAMVAKAPHTPLPIRNFATVEQAGKWLAESC